jgi:hypothetical protein
VSARFARILSLATLLAGPCVLAGAPDSALDDLMALLAQRRHGEADFREEQYLSVLKRPVTSTGVLTYDAPDHLEQRTVTPRAQSFALDHGTLSMRIGSHARTLPVSDYPQLAPLIDSIRATLAGDRAALERVFTLEFTGSVNRWKLHLTPRDERVNATLTQIDLEGERDAVREVQVLQRDGDRSLMHITPRE